MRFEKRQWRLNRNNANFRSGATGLPGKILAVAGGAALLVAAVMVSLVMLAVVLTGALFIGGFVWWKTRELRKQMREQARERVIKGGVIEDVKFDDRIER